MRFSATVVLAATAANAASVAYRSFEFPESVPMLERRQEPGTPRYECHSNCGNALKISRGSDFCDNSEFTTQFSACLECALEFDIWQYYGSGLTTAAEKCGLDATPKPSGGSSSSTAESTSAAQPTSSAASSAAQSSAAQSSAAQSSSAVESSAAQTSADATSAPVSSSSAVETGKSDSSKPASTTGGAVASTTPGSAVSTPTAVPTTSRTGGNSTITTGTGATPVPTAAGAAQLLGSKVLVAGAAIFVAVNMM